MMFFFFFFLVLFNLAVGSTFFVPHQTGQGKGVRLLSFPARVLLAALTSFATARDVLSSSPTALAALPARNARLGASPPSETGSWGLRRLQNWANPICFIFYLGEGWGRTSKNLKHELSA